jgi:hypothetical protein
MTEQINILWDIETGPLPDAELARLQQATSKEFPKDKLALSAQTGRILAIGTWQDGYRSPEIFSADRMDEREIIERFMWQLCGAIAHGGKGVMIGFNTLAFDLPFVLQRMWAHGLNWQEDFPLFAEFQQCDLMERWRLPAGMVAEPTARISLGGLAAHLGVNCYKSGRGEDFAALIESDPEAAKRYLVNDLKLLAHCAPRMVADLKGCFRNIIQPTEE